MRRRLPHLCPDRVRLHTLTHQSHCRYSLTVDYRTYAKIHYGIIQTEASQLGRMILGC